MIPANSRSFSEIRTRVPQDRYDRYLPLPTSLPHTKRLGVCTPLVRHKGGELMRVLIRHGSMRFHPVKGAILVASAAALVLPFASGSASAASASHVRIAGSAPSWVATAKV